MMDMQLIIENLRMGGKYCCSRALFAVVNRTLNEHGYRARIENMEADILTFEIEKDIRQRSQATL